MTDILPRSSRRLLAGTMPLLLLLSACTVGPDFVRPTPTLPAAFQGARGPAQPFEATWWSSFGDPALDALEARAISNNLDIAMALERITAAQAQYGLARAQGMPTVNAQAGYTRERIGTVGVAGFARPLLGLGNGGSDGPKGVDFDLYSIGGGASWEIDLWGRVRRMREAAGARVDEARAEADGMRLSVHAEIARSYFQWRQLEQEIAQAEHSRALAEQAVVTVRSLKERGLAGSADLIDSESRVRTIRDGEIDLRNQRDALRRALAVLVDGRPDAPLTELEQPRGNVTLPSPPGELPSDMARRRPDILAAEARLHAATAEIGVAKAEFYPSINLSGLFNLDALSLKTLGWDSRDTSAGGTVSLPIFSGGRLERTLELRKAEQRGAAVSYQATVVNAWKEVEDALSALHALNERAALTDAECDARRANAAMVARRQMRGDIGLLPGLSARAQAIDAETAALRQRTAVLLAYVQLYRALGG